MRGVRADKNVPQHKFVDGIVSTGPGTRDSEPSLRRNVHRVLCVFLQEKVSPGVRTDTNVGAATLQTLL